MLACSTPYMNNEEAQGDEITSASSFQATNLVTIVVLWHLLCLLHLCLGGHVNQVCQRLCCKLEKHTLSSWTVCPRRRARQLKCAKRCAAKRDKCYSSRDQCAISACCAKLAKLHLPAPLPWRKKKSTKSQNVVVVHKEEKEAEQATSAANSTEAQASNQEKECENASVRPITGVLHPAQTPLIDLARMQHWEMILKHATRKEAKYRDSDGLYPLHWAVSGGPPTEVVDKLLEIYPSAAHKKDKEGSTPLHFATHYAASPRVVESLLKTFPKAARMQDRYGRSPLYHAVEKCITMDSLKLLVQADPSMITTPCLPKEHRDLPTTRTFATMTPLYVSWAVAVRDHSMQTRGSGHTRKRKSCKPYQKALLLLEAAYFHMRNVSPLIPRDYHYIAGAIALDLYLPKDVLSLLVDQYPKQVVHQDEDGRVALAQVAAGSQYSLERSDTLISLLLLANKNAATMRDRSGRLPLQLALFAGKTWSSGVSHLLNAFPEALHEVDESSQLPAFAAAASHEAQDAFTQSGGLIHEDTSPLWKIRRHDPFQLLNSKQRSLLERARQRVEQDKTCPSLEQVEANSFETEAERLTTILHLLRSEPSVLKSVI